MTILANLKIKYKLSLMLFFPLLGLLYLAPMMVLEKYQEAKNMNRLGHLVQLSVELANILHQLQSERDFSSALSETQHGSSDKFAGPLKQQRLQTDDTIEQLLTHFEITHFDETLQLAWAKVVNTLQSIKAKRLIINPQLMTETEVLDTYSNMNNQLIQLIQELTTLHQHEGIITLALSYLFFLSGDELAGIERSMLFGVLSQKQFEGQEFKHFVQLVAQQQLYRRTIFTFLATPDQRAFWAQQSQNRVFPEVQAIREQIYTVGNQGVIDNIDPDHWFQLQTAKMELLKEVENKLATDLSTTAKDIEAQAYTQLMMIQLIIGALLTLTVMFVYLLLKGMTAPLSQAVTVANAIAKGQLNNHFDHDTHDETGQLLQALATMQTLLKQRSDEDKKIADATSRINCALGNVTTNILIADNNYRIIYLNHRAQQLFNSAEELIQQDLPHFKANRLLNRQIDEFHQAPQRIRQLLESLTTTHQAMIKIGGLTLEMNITPVINAQNERLGAVVELTNRTLEVATMQEINTVVQSATQGNFASRINLENKTGFFAEFSKSINLIMDLIQSMVEDLIQMLSALAQGNLTRTIQKNYAGEFEQLKTDANTTVHKLIEVMEVIKQSAAVVNQATAELSAGNINLSQRTEEQAASLQQIAASMEQITGTIQQNADNAEQANQLALTAKHLAEQGGGVVGTTVQAMNEISQSSQQITDIISIINEIAFQTNLLALNAAVEAARAGEQGRGFAVVAAEVRNLAQRSAKAAKQIKTLIQDSVSKVAEGRKLANQSGETLSEIVNAIKQVSGIVAQIANASREQATGIQYVNTALTQIDATTQQNGALVEQATAASKSLTEQAQQLKQQVEFFQLD